MIRTVLLHRCGLVIPTQEGKYHETWCVLKDAVFKERGNDTNSKYAHDTGCSYHMCVTAKRKERRKLVPHNIYDTENKDNGEVHQHYI